MDHEVEGKICSSLQVRPMSLNMPRIHTKLNNLQFWVCTGPTAHPQAETFLEAYYSLACTEG